MVFSSSFFLFWARVLLSRPSWHSLAPGLGAAVSLLSQAGWLLHFTQLKPCPLDTVSLSTGSWQPSFFLLLRGLVGTNLHQTLSFHVVTSEECPGFVRLNLILSQAYATFSLPVTAWLSVICQWEEWVSWFETHTQKQPCGFYSNFILKFLFVLKQGLSEA